MKSIWYVYPQHHTVSFTFIAREHIRLLRKKWRIQEIPEKGFLHIHPSSKPLVFVHPMLYIATQNLEKFDYQRLFYDTLIGVEVADSDRISNLAANIINKADAVILPSQWSKESYLRSGVRIPIHVVPHGLRKMFYQPKTKPQTDVLKEALRLKKLYGWVFFSFFCWHSPARKGYDLVIEAMKEIQRTHKNTVIIVWQGTYMKDFSDHLRLLRFLLSLDFLEEP